AIVGRLAICIVFFPVALLQGPAKYLFTPLALAVVFAMLASYVLSRTLVPLLARLLMPGEEHAASTPSALQRKRDEIWNRFQAGFGRALETVLAHRRFTLVTALVLALSGAALLTVVGTDFFPPVDAGLMKLHFRAPAGTRIEETERLVVQVERRIRETIPADELETVNDMIGVPLFYNLAFVPTDNIGAMDAEILIALKAGHRPTARYMRALQLGLAQRDVANSMLISLSSSGLIAPSFFLNPANNVNYAVAVQTPIARLASVPSLLATPLTPASGTRPADPSGAPSLAEAPEAPAVMLGNVASVSPGAAPGVVSHYTVQRVLDVEAGVEGRDLGGVVGDIRSRIAALGALPPGMRITVRGQGEVMNAAVRRVGLGLNLAIVLVYCLMVVLFQSWVDPFIIMAVVPGALVGILWMLALTGPTLNVGSLSGSLMAVGSALSNSIPLVAFANDRRVETGGDALGAALEAGKTRLRPVLMTALAMIIGMVPMAVGLGEGGEQNAPLGRAVIGGLLLATAATLFVVPVVYSLIRTEPPTSHLLDERFLAEERGETR